MNEGLGTGTAKQLIEERRVALEPGDDGGTSDGATRDEQLPPANAVRRFGLRGSWPCARLCR